MLIKDLLELIKKVSLPQAAKQIEIGRDRLQAFLKDNGFEHKRGTKEWLYKGENAAILDEDIYNHVHKTPANAPRKREPNRKKTSQQSTNAEKQNDNYTENKPTNNPTKQPEKQTLKKVTYEIEENLHDELKIMAVRQKRKVSEIVNELIKKGLEQEK